MTRNSKESLSTRLLPRTPGCFGLCITTTALKDNSQLTEEVRTPQEVDDGGVSGAGGVGTNSNESSGTDSPMVIELILILI